MYKITGNFNIRYNKIMKLSKVKVLKIIVMHYTHISQVNFKQL